MIILESILDNINPSENDAIINTESDDSDFYIDDYKYLIAIHAYKEGDVHSLENVIRYTFDAFGIEPHIQYVTGDVFKLFINKTLAVRPEADDTYMCICLDEFPKHRLE